MKIGNKWALLATGIALILMSGVTRNAGASYERTDSSDGNEDSPDQVRTETKWEIGAAGGAGFASSGLALCAAQSYTWASGDSADLTVYGWGLVRFEWEWTGAPGTAPGGSLYWEHDGDGDGDAEGATDGQATSYGCAFSRTWVDVDVTWSWADGTAYGYVSGSSMAQGDAWGEASPQDPYFSPTEDPDNGSFYYAIDWSTYYDDVTSIASGTSYFYVRGQADCQCQAYSNSTSPGDAYADTTSGASVLAYADFTSN